MIKVEIKDGKIVGMRCDCGNTHNFARYQTFEIVKDKTGRNRSRKRNGIACAKKGCGEILKQDDLELQMNLVNMQLN